MAQTSYGTITVVDVSDGAQWYSGTAITGTSVTPTIFANSGIAYAVEGDMYLNTSTNNTYRCALSGDASTAKWVYINNIKGQSGQNGVSISSIVSEYCLSSSSASADGNWSTQVPSYISGYYYWTRQLVTWSNNTTSYSPSTAGVLDNSLTDANRNAATAVSTANIASQTATEAAKTATKYITKIDDSGIKIQSYDDTNSAADTNNYIQLNGDGLDIYKDGVSIAQYGEIVRIGTNEGSKIEIANNNMSMLVDGTPLIQMRLNDEKMDVNKNTHGKTYVMNGETSLTYVFDVELYPDIIDAKAIKLNFRFIATDRSQVGSTVRFNYGTAKSVSVSDSGLSCELSYDGLQTITMTNPTLTNGDISYIIIFGSYILSKNTASIILGATEQNVYKPFTVTEGYNCQAIATYAHAEGLNTIASQSCAHSEGSSTEASGFYSHAEGYGTKAIGPRSHAEGENTEASNYDSHAEGFYTTASGNYSHAEGYYSTASGEASHVEGYYTTASNNRSHAEGDYTKAIGYSSHAEGTNSVASNYASHAENRSTASGEYSHAEGRSTASGSCSHAEGYYTEASGDYSHSSGQSTIASGACQMAVGKYNVSDETSLFIVGNGKNTLNRSNAFSVDSDGNANVSGNFNAVGEITQNGTAVALNGHTHSSTIVYEDVTVSISYAAGNTGTRGTQVNCGTTSKSGYVYMGASILSHINTSTFSVNLIRNDSTANLHLMAYRANGNAVTDAQVVIRKIWIKNEFASAV